MCVRGCARMRITNKRCLVGVCLSTNCVCHKGLNLPCRLVGSAYASVRSRLFGVRFGVRFRAAVCQQCMPCAAHTMATLDCSNTGRPVLLFEPASVRVSRHPSQRTLVLSERQQPVPPFCTLVCSTLLQSQRAIRCTFDVVLMLDVSCRLKNVFDVVRRRGCKTKKGIFHPQGLCVCDVPSRAAPCVWATAATAVRCVGREGFRGRVVEKCLMKEPSCRSLSRLCRVGGHVAALRFPRHQNLLNLR